MQIDYIKIRKLLPGADVDSARYACIHLLSIWGLMVLFPFYWMLLTSVKSYNSYNSEHIPAFFTLSPTLQNYKDAFTSVPLARLSGKYPDFHHRNHSGS